MLKPAGLERNRPNFAPRGVAIQCIQGAFDSSKYSEVFVLISFGTFPISEKNILKTACRRAKRTKIWDPGLSTLCIRSTFCN